MEYNKEEYKELVNQQVVASKIYTVRGVQVILDYDLAEFYGVETKQLKPELFIDKKKETIFLA